MMAVKQFIILLLVCSSWTTLATAQVCGVPGLSVSESIIGGFISRAGVFPWQLAIETESGISGSDLKLHCGGVIIDESWGLTAAHCVTPRGLQLVAIAGLYNQSQIDPANIRRLNLEHITIFPQFNPITLLNDIAIIRFSTPYDLSTPTIKSMCLPPSATTSYVENPNCYITGWGATEPGGQQSEPLKRISTDVLRDEHCYLRMNNRTVLPTEVCAFDEVSRTETPCDGDMGGALGCVWNARFYVAGIGSFVDSNCNATQPQIYTNVPKYVDWIHSVTGITQL